MNTRSKLSRRQFLKLAGAGIGGLVTAHLLSACNQVPTPEPTQPPLATDLPGRSLSQQQPPGELVEINLVAKQASINILPGQETRLWQYQASLVKGSTANLQTFPGSYLGPIIRMQRGQTLRVNFKNQINEPTSIHWHGLSVPEEMDGHPRHAIVDGQTYTYEFPILNRAGTYWFHPHPHQRTGPQVYYGLAGLLIISDIEEANLDLPSGEFDLPLVIQDRLFDNQNQLDYSGNPMTGFLGEHILVNGKPDYILKAAATSYRLRLLNGSNARIYKLAWDDGLPMNVIATDGGLLHKPIKRNAVTLAPGERIELFADFSQDSPGTQRSLVSQAFDAGVMGMRGMMGGPVSAKPQGSEFRVMSLQITRPGTPGSNPPENLLSTGFLSQAEATNRHNPRRFELTMHMVGFINGRTFEMESVSTDEVVNLGDIEVWEFANPGGGMGMMAGSDQPHPMHIHGVQFQVVERILESGSSQAYQTMSEGFVDIGWKDTVLVMPGEVVRVLVKFDHYAGLFLYHCHNLEHEDSGMMRNFRVEG